MEYGILGAGHIGQALAAHLTRTGHSVILSNSRGPASLAGVVESLGGDARAGTTAEAAAAPVVFLTLTWSVLPGVLPALPAWDGRIVVDATNPFVAEGDGFRLVDLGDRTSSEIVAEMLPGARLVKAFNTLPAAVLAADPHEAGGRRVVFVSGDDPAARKEIAALARVMGFATVDLRGLAAGGALQSAGGPLAGANLVKLG
jgi:predicted dinucleotide-binding enzyme